MAIRIPKKLIEVALPLDDINAACAHEKMPGIGAHPRGIHLWWARRPLAAARAVLFAQMVNDPGGERGWSKGKTKAQADMEREALFDIIRDLVKWENTDNEEVLGRARKAIWDSWKETCALNEGKLGFDPEKLPAFHDPFAGGGAIPLEAQRLGLESYASDLNPVAVMINKAMIEIPPKFAGQTPIGPIPEGEQAPDSFVEWDGVKGLAEDVRRYGHWMWKEAFTRIGHLYPPVKAIQERDGSWRYATEHEIKTKGSKLQDFTVIAWIWARTVKSSNPAYSHVDVPLVKSFILSTKKNRDAWVHPHIDGDSYTFEIRNGKPPIGAKNGTKLARGANFRCLLSDTPLDGDYIKQEGKEGRMGAILMAVVCDGPRGRVYLPPTCEAETKAREAIPSWIPDMPIAPDKRALWTPPYGLTTYGDLFTKRQLCALGTFSELLQLVRLRILEDALNHDIPKGLRLAEKGVGSEAYADAISTYLSFVLDRCADFNNALTGWRAGNEKIMYLFARQAIPMAWDYGEANIMARVVGGFLTNLEYQVKCMLKLPAVYKGYASQADAATQVISNNKVVSTDPPYYDNIGYADLSDFFYVWMRRSLRTIFPDLFATIAIPKAEELVATPYRHGGKEQAEEFFMSGMTNAMHSLTKQTHSGYPVTIYYAFKQSETKDIGTANTGWETFLEAVLQAGFAIGGTWPMRSEQSSRMIGIGNNALASSIVLVCKKREGNSQQISRKNFLRELREAMPEALEVMIGGQSGRSPIAPVDLAQAAIGPGMAVFSKYEAVLNQDGSPMSVHDAMILINRAITDYLNPDEGNFDADTVFCSAWFDQYGWGQGPFGDADTLTRAKGTSVDGVNAAGVIESGGGNVKLLKWAAYPKEWDPTQDNRTPIWEACHHMIRTLNTEGETSSGALLAQMPERAEPIRQLAYHLYTLCERKGWADDARAYNELITSWSAIMAASLARGHINEQLGMAL